jgi:hypothetical protein
MSDDFISEYQKAKNKEKSIKNELTKRTENISKKIPNNIVFNYYVI